MSYGWKAPFNYESPFIDVIILTLWTQIINIKLVCMQHWQSHFGRIFFFLSGNIFPKHSLRVFFLHLPSTILFNSLSWDKETKSSYLLLSVFTEKLVAFIVTRTNIVLWLLNAWGNPYLYTHNYIVFLWLFPSFLAQIVSWQSYSSLNAGDYI